MAKTADPAQEQDVLKISLMASFEKPPTKQNLHSVLQNNSLKRNDALCDFLRFLDRIDYPCAVALDGRWGSGKTFFVKEAQMILTAENPMIRQKDDVLNLPLPLKMQHRFLPIYYDAWRNDNAIDPLLSLIYTIASDERINKEDYFDKNPSFRDKLTAAAASVSIAAIGGKIGGALGTLTGQAAGGAVGKAVGTAAGTAAGTAIDSIFKYMKELKKTDHPLGDTEKEKDLEEEISRFLAECLGKDEEKKTLPKAERLVIFIDELDRCKPTFAVQLLERIKHYFHTKNVTFVLAINSVELIHTIRAVYGQEFDATRYLDRFFDFRIGLPQADISLYLKQMQFIDEKETQEIYSDEILRSLAEKYNLSLREIEKLCRALRTIGGYQITRVHYFVQKGLKSEDLIYPVAVYDSVNVFCYYILLPITLVLKMTDSGQYDTFISGRNAKPLTELFEQSKAAKEYIMNHFQGEMKPLGVLIKDITNLECLYREIFKYNSGYMDDFLGMVNLLSPFASYHV